MLARDEAQVAVRGGEKERLCEAVRACVQHNVCCFKFILHGSSCGSRAMKCGEWRSGSAVAVEIAAIVRRNVELQSRRLVE